MEILLTKSEELKQTDYYKTVVMVVRRMMDSGVIHMSARQCVSASDMMAVSLGQHGIKCKLVECQVIIESTINGAAEQHMIGFNSLSHGAEVDTHVVCVTETEIPMIIDTSIIHILGQFSKAALVDQLVEQDNRVIYDASLPNLKITYQSKKTQSIPVVHQMSILDRIETDKSVFKQLKILKWFIIGALFISFSNAIRGGYDAYQVYVVDNNHWGPSAMHDVIDRLDKIEKKLK